MHLKDRVGVSPKKVTPGAARPPFVTPLLKGEIRTTTNGRAGRLFTRTAQRFFILTFSNEHDSRFHENLSQVCDSVRFHVLR
ncbi:hypothetical protein J6590_078375 [Homalodisca vitripennis]|nr:hypothetical protein J6590_078375 [Homalodisca vitripennis]